MKGNTMNFESAREFSSSLRRLARSADVFGYDRKELLMSLVQIAEKYEEVADDLEMKKIVQMQRDWVEAN
jgi:hypothetical protein